jgi:hypothetical protein
MKIYFYVILIVGINSCETGKSKQRETSNVDQVREDSLVNKKKVLLIESVLNLPTVLVFSKVRLYKERREKIYILLQEDEFKGYTPSIIQDGQQLGILHSLDSTQAETLPCYRFKMDLSGDKASVSLFQETTGAIAYGDLNYINGHWVPDEKFTVGVR